MAVSTFTQLCIYFQTFSPSQLTLGFHFPSSQALANSILLFWFFVLFFLI